MHYFFRMLASILLAAYLMPAFGNEYLSFKIEPAFYELLTQKLDEENIWYVKSEDHSIKIKSDDILQYHPLYQSVKDFILPDILSIYLTIEVHSKVTELLKQKNIPFKEECVYGKKWLVIDYDHYQETIKVLDYVSMQRQPSWSKQAIICP